MGRGSWTWEYLLRETLSEEDERLLDLCLLQAKRHTRRTREANSALDGAYWPTTLIYQTATLQRWVLGYWSGMASAHLAPSPGPCPVRPTLAKGEGGGE
jgi:hypothetical protein